MLVLHKKLLKERNKVTSFRQDIVRSQLHPVVVLLMAIGNGGSRIWRIYEQMRRQMPG